MARYNYVTLRFDPLAEKSGGGAAAHVLARRAPYFWGTSKLIFPFPRPTPVTCDAASPRGPGLPASRCCHCGPSPP
eukprot:scaffold47213_cov270-Isochrysis_galbana.AAC.4